MGMRCTAVSFFRGVTHRQCCFAGYVHAVIIVRKQEQQGVNIINTVRYWQGALKCCTDIQLSWRDQQWRA